MRSAIKIILGVFTFLIAGALGYEKEAISASYPEKPVTVVVSFPAGSDTGISCTKLVNIINQGKFWPQGIQVVYKPGGVGTIGLAEVLQGRADGYTLAYNPSAPILVQPLVKNLPYNLKSMIPVIQILKFSWIILVQSDAPWKNIGELFKYAKDHPDEVTMGTPGDFTWGHIPLLQIGKATKLKFRHVPFEGSSPTLIALLGGHVKAAILSTGTAAAQITAGKVKALACVERERAIWPSDVPTLSELGYDVKGTTHTMLLVLPKGASETIVEKVHAVFKKAMDTEEFTSFSKIIGATPAYMGYKELPNFLENTKKEMITLLEEVGVKVRK